MKIAKRFTIIVGMFFVFALVFVCLSDWSNSAEVKPRYGGTIRIAEQIDGASIGYPPKSVRVAGLRQVAPVIETLLRIDKAGNISPWLATGVKEDPKAKTISMTLRKGIKFHDGTDFNAEAVKWNLEQGVAAKAPGTDKFGSIDIADNQTVRINLNEWDSTTVSNLAQTLGMMISPTAFKKNGEEWAGSHPVGTGPFQFVSWEKDTKTVYRKFPGYWQKGKPYVDAIEWYPITDALTRQFSLRKGEMDLLVMMPGKDLSTLEKDSFAVNRRTVGSGVTTLVFDSANPKSPFANVKVRQAAQYAVDAGTIVKTILLNEAQVPNQWIYKGHWGYNPSVVGYPYDPVKAKKLLAEAGYPSGFKTKILYRTNPEDDQIYTAVQGYLKAVGIEAELDPSATGRYDQVAMQGGAWEGLIVNATSSNPDVVAYLAQRYAGGGKFFSQMLIPADYAAAIKNAISAPDFKTKQKWTKDAMKLMADKYCLQLMIFKRYNAAVSQKYVHSHGFYETPNEASWTPEDVWMDK
jgi:peptide/nickel transport system substrate-binding protein